MRRDDAYLLDMLIAARDVVTFLQGFSREQFGESRLHQQAVMKCLEIIGEAAARVSESTRAVNPNIQWQQIIGMRHRLVHGYFEIDLDKVWDTVRNDIPSLIAKLEPLVPPEEA
jgi:uncharacterized protein with HEPN domain